MTLSLDCQKLKEQELKILKETITKEKLKPKLTIIQVGHQPAQDTYIKHKLLIAKEIGIEAEYLNHKEEVTNQEIRKIINEKNNDPTCNGILIQLPLPKHLDEDLLINTINPIKDIDGLTDINLGAIVSKEPKIIPCTAKGVMLLLEKLNIPLKDKKVVIIGRSKLVGIPLSLLLLKKDATVTICHSKTTNLKKETKQADILITAVGNQKNLITKNMIKPEAIVIDVAISKDENGNLYGDVNYENIKRKASYVTPVPKGVGQLTVLSLMQNIIEVTRKQTNLQ